jgi:hypothetical protein
VDAELLHAKKLNQKPMVLHVSSWPKLKFDVGQSVPALPINSDIHLFGSFEGVVDLNSEVSDGALNFGMSEEQLNCSQVASAFINHGGFCPPQ